MADKIIWVSKFFQNGDDVTMTTLNSNSSPSETVDCIQDLSQSSVTSDSDPLSLSKLTIEEQEPFEIKPFYNITPREMPLSPHYVYEEEFSSNPWAMLIATIFLNKTSGYIARPVMKSFFEYYPTPYHVLRDNPIGLERFFNSLGLRKRGHMIWKLTYQFVSSKWRRASDLCGIGKYGEDAYRIFCLGHTETDPDDRYLKLYLAWLSRTDFLEQNGMVDSEYVIEDPVLKYYRITLKR